MLLLLLTILVVGWLFSSNIKWILIMATVFLLTVGPCRRRGDEQEATSYQPVMQETELSPTGLPVKPRTYYALNPEQLHHDQGW